MRLCWADGSEVLGSPLAAVEPLRPIPVEAPVASVEPLVDVLIAIYRGREGSLACIQGVLDSLDANQTPMNVVVLDDESPEPELSQALRELDEAGWIKLHRSPANLGFIRNMNRGMTLHPARDVVWLNADARVCDEWLDRLREAAYSAADVATATLSETTASCSASRKAARTTSCPRWTNSVLCIARQPATSRLRPGSRWVVASASISSSARRSRSACSTRSSSSAVMAKKPIGA